LGLTVLTVTHTHTHTHTSCSYVELIIESMLNEFAPPHTHFPSSTRLRSLHETDIVFLYTPYTHTHTHTRTHTLKHLPIKATEKSV